MRNLLTPKQVALAIGVSEASLKRWCDKGLIRAVRTEGGHRRLALDDVLAFLRHTGRPIVSPELLRLPPVGSTGERARGKSLDHLVDAIVQGDEARVHRLVFDLYLAKHRLSDIGDSVIAKAFERIGEKWQCSELEPYQERRGCEIVGRVLAQLRSGLPAVPATASLAIGGTIAGDNYRLPTMLVELVLRGEGWRAESLGSNLPATTLVAAIRELKPSLFWLSVSHIESRGEFIEQYRTVYTAARQFKVPVAVGGRALDHELRHEMDYSAFCDNLRHLTSFIATLAPATGQG